MVKYAGMANPERNILEKTWKSVKDKAWNGFLWFEDKSRKITIPAGIAFTAGAAAFGFPSLAIASGVGVGIDYVTGTWAKNAREKNRGGGGRIEHGIRVPLLSDLWDNIRGKGSNRASQVAYNSRQSIMIPQQAEYSLAA